ncbi:MAG: cyclase family protein, partial [Methanolinea sp.]|nr:cyclase family protein [Methanolinea sp.]
MDGRGERVTWHDITRPVKEGMVVYPGDIIPRIVQEDHGRYVLSCLRMSTHTGTHIDAPCHYLKGAPSVDRIPMEKLAGLCRVVEAARGSPEIKEEELSGYLEETDRILLKTPFSKKVEFEEEYPGLSPDAAVAIADAGVLCVGIDSPSIEPFSGDGQVHRTLLSHGVVIIELLDLAAVPPGEYWMVALPLR